MLHTTASGLDKSESSRARQRVYWDADQGERRASDHPAVVALFGPRADYLADLSGHLPEASILDVGSGNGFLAAPLQSRFSRTAALDLSMAMLTRNPCRNRIQASVTDLPFGSSSFDLVVCSHLLHHLIRGDRARAVQEMTRVARHAVILYEPNRNNPAMFLFGLVKAEERMSLEFSRSYVEGLLETAGLSRCQARIEGTVLPNKTPRALVPFGQFLARTPARRFGFYVRAIGWKR